MRLKNPGSYAYICGLMKKAGSIFLFLLLLVCTFSCKDKKKTDPAPQPEPQKFGTLNFTVVTYDSAGRMENDHSGVQVSLVQEKRAASTTSAGIVSFEDLPYGTHTPVLQKDYLYDAPLMSVYLQEAAFHAVLPFPRYCMYDLSNLNAQAYTDGNVYMSFNVSPSIPFGDTCKVVIIASQLAGMTHRKFTSADLIEIHSSKITDYNISLLPNFHNLLQDLDSAAVFYVSAVPVSYGLYQSNMQEIPQLLGRSPVYPGNIALTKRWKN